MAHTPENTNYLLGKGVYPKVTSDDLVDTTTSVFTLYTGNQYTSYDQSSRYTELTGA
ncbi:MAG: hypothetical protein IE920_11040 [Thiotrichales bacterium]|nr:hypothetical protein [Thiotrichales bacterium]